MLRLVVPEFGVPPPNVLLVFISTSTLSVYPSVFAFTFCTLLFCNRFNPQHSGRTTGSTELHKNFAASEILASRTSFTNQQPFTVKRNSKNKMLLKRCFVVTVASHFARQTHMDRHSWCKASLNDAVTQIHSFCHQQLHSAHTNVRTFSLLFLRIHRKVDGTL